MKITDPKDLQIGHWYADCCAHGLYQIENDADLEMVRGDMDPEYYSVQVGTWETREEALADLEARGLGLDDETY